MAQLKEIALVGASLEAKGHPDDCSEPASGTVQEQSKCTVTLNGTQFATVATANLHFDKHAHDYSDEDGCHEKSSHDISGSSNLSGSASMEYNGEPILVEGEVVASDPKTDDDVTVVDSGGNTTVKETN